MRYACLSDSKEHNPIWHYQAALSSASSWRPSTGSGENPTLGMERDLETIQWLDYLGFDEAWIGEHHSSGWETIASPELFIATAAERTRHIRLGTGVVSLPYHHPLMVANRMVQLDHITRGRVMMGVGPGALVSDAYMLGIDHDTQRPRMDESLGIIMRLLTETEPITYEADWFTLREAMIHLRPYTPAALPHRGGGVPVSDGHDSGGQARRGGPLGERSSGAARYQTNLRDFWKIGEETAAKHGNTLDRNEWRLVMPVHIAESRKEAIEAGQERRGAVPAGLLREHDGLRVRLRRFPRKGSSTRWSRTRRGVWARRTIWSRPSRGLDEASGGFGGLLVQATEWATREQVLHSYELIARYVMPVFQGSLVNLEASQRWASDNRHDLMALRTKSITQVAREYEQGR